MRWLINNLDSFGRNRGLRYHVSMGYGLSWFQHYWWSYKFKLFSYTELYDYLLGKACRYR
jgi:hypothetical protein